MMENNRYCTIDIDCIISIHRTTHEVLIAKLSSALGEGKAMIGADSDPKRKYPSQCDNRSKRWITGKDTSSHHHDDYRSSIEILLRDCTA